MSQRLPAVKPRAQGGLVEDGYEGAAFQVAGVVGECDAEL